MSGLRTFLNPFYDALFPLPHSPGLTFDIYEGQITALLGHSGAGKSTLMNVLCGICPPTDGLATIYGSPVAEIADGSEMKQLVGICPQFNIIFDVLTVEEHLRIFAAIKGILPADTDTEVVGGLFSPLAETDPAAATVHQTIICSFLISRFMAHVCLSARSPKY